MYLNFVPAQAPVDAMKTRYLFLWILLGMLVLALPLLISRPRQNALDELQQVVRIGPHFTVEQLRQPELQEYARAANGTVIADVWVFHEMSASAAARFSKGEQDMLESVFDEQVSPYPGDLSNRIKCQDKYLPLKQEFHNKGSWLVLYTLYVNDRFVFGGCTDDVLKYAAVISMIYCENRATLFKAIFYTPISEPLGLTDLKNYTCSV
jgi:hypothetical protein